MAGNNQGFLGPPRFGQAPPQSFTQYPPAINHSSTVNNFVANPAPGQSASVRADEKNAPLLSQGSIALYVGRPSDYRKFTIHKDLLVKHSDYFYAIFVNGGRLVEGWMEGKEREVTLATDHPEPFEMFQRFLYIGRIFSRKDNSNVKLEPDSEDPEWARLWSAWELGQKFLSTTFKDAITNAVYEKIRNDTYPVHAYERIYPKSSQISGIRKLLAESAVRYWSTEALMAQRGQSEAHHEFFFDLALALSAAHNQPGHFSNVHDCALVACR